MSIDEVYELKLRCPVCGYSVAKINDFNFQDLEFDSDGERHFIRKIGYSVRCPICDTATQWFEDPERALKAWENFGKDII